VARTVWLRIVPRYPPVSAAPSAAPRRVELFFRFVLAAKGAQDQRPTAYGRGCTQKGKKPRIGTAAAHPPDSEDAIERPAHKEGEAKKGG